MWLACESAQMRSLSGAMLGKKDLLRGNVGRLLSPLHPGVTETMLVGGIRDRNRFVRASYSVSKPQAIRS